MASVFALGPAGLPVIPAAAGGVSAAVDVRAAGGPLTFRCTGNDGDKIRVQGSPDGVNLWGDVCVIANNGVVQSPSDMSFGFLRFVRDVVDPSPGVVLLVPQVSIVAQPQPAGYGFATAAVLIPAGDGVGASVNLQASSLTNEVAIGPAMSIVCSAFDPGDKLTLESSADNTAPWQGVMDMQQGKILSVPASLGWVRIRRSRVPAAGPRVGVDGATAAFMGCAVGSATGTPTPVQVGNYNAQPNDVVLADPTGGAFNVTLPPAAASGLGARVRVKNKSDSANAVTVVRQGGDTIDGAAAGDVLGAREAQLYISDGVSDWMRF